MSFVNKTVFSDILKIFSELSAGWIGSTLSKVFRFIRIRKWALISIFIWILAVESRNIENFLHCHWMLGTWLRRPDDSECHWIREKGFWLKSPLDWTLKTNHNRNLQWWTSNSLVEAKWNQARLLDCFVMPYDQKHITQSTQQQETTDCQLCWYG